MSVAITGLKSAIQSGSLQVTSAMLDEQLSRIDRINKEQELLRYAMRSGKLTQEQSDRIKLLSRILNIENVYLRIMQRSLEQSYSVKFSS